MSLFGADCTSRMLLVWSLALCASLHRFWFCLQLSAVPVSCFLQDPFPISRYSSSKEMSESVCTGRFRERSVLWAPGSALPDPPLAKAKACKMVRNHISCRCRGASLWLVVPWLAIIEQSSQEHSLCKCVISRKKSFYVINTDRFWRFTATFRSADLVTR
jgi:hypothetical protein